MRPVTLIGSAPGRVSITDTINPEDLTMPDHNPSPFASSSVPRHLLRGVVGFGLIGASLLLAASGHPVALVLLVPGVVALRGCPTCWTVGLFETISAGRLRRDCADGSCTVGRGHARQAL
jgi:hypothetical protein